MAEVLLRDRLERRGIEAQVSSAGLVSDGVAASPGSVRAMAQRGLDLSPHRSTPLDHDAVAQADLVLGMTREHVREAVVLVPEAFERSFTLRELVRRADEVGPPTLLGPSGGAPSDPGGPATGRERFGPWLVRLGAGRRAIDLVGSDDRDDLADPMGRSRRFYDRTAAEIEDLVDRFVDVALPAPSSAPPR